jgi:hypothetical protein
MLRRCKSQTAWGRPMRRRCREMDRARWCVLGVMALVRCWAPGATAADAESHRETVVKVVAQIQRADYEGNRAVLQRLYANLEPFTADKKIGSRVRYWRGFALWRRAINGFNENADPKDQEGDLTQGLAEFKEAIQVDPGFVDAKIGAISCLSNLVYLARGNTDRVQELIGQSSPMVKEVKASDPDNPRFLWVIGPILWNIPADGGQDKAMEGYLRGLDAAGKRKSAAGDPLDPSWGEPELLMSLGWSELNRTTADLDAAEKHARSALALVPYWHYVRDILLPQIEKAKAAAKS